MADSKAISPGLVFVALLGLIVGTVFWATQAPAWPSLLLFTNLFALALYDWYSFRLPNLMTATYFLSGILVLWADPPLAATDHIIGAVVGLLLFPAINLLYKQLRGRDGIGLGDAKLLAGTGLWLGWQALPPVLLLASLGGLVFAALSMLARRDITRETKLPFGPFLCFGTWLWWLWLWLPL